MRRWVHIVLTLVTVLVLLRPFDCLEAMVNRKAADCCAKGKCLPTRDADECCRNKVPAGNQFAATKPSHGSLTPGSEYVAVPIIPALSREVISFANADLNPAPSPPGSPPGSSRNLPLL